MVVAPIYELASVTLVATVASWTLVAAVASVTVVVAGPLVEYLYFHHCMLWEKTLKCDSLVHLLLGQLHYC